MIGFLNKAYPLEPFSLKNVRANAWIGLFISFFLIVFEPFSINEWQTNHKFLKLLSFGFISFLVPTIIQILFAKTLSGNKWMENWKTWKEILIIFIILVIIALGNMLLANLYAFSHLHLTQFINVLAITGLTGLFPIAASVSFKYQKFLALNLKTAGQISLEIEKRKVASNNFVVTSEAEAILFLAENNKDIFKLLPSQLLYIESADNYCTLFFMQDAKKKKELIRSSLKRLETQITVSTILRCHRSYIVNICAVSGIEGNAQGYRISFKDCEDTIPVSRNYGKTILECLKSLD